MTSLIAGVLASSDGSSGGSILSLLFLPGLVVLLYFVMIRPQRRRMRQQAEAQANLQSALGIGSEVVTVAGIHGTVTGEDGDDVLWLEIDDDVQVRIDRAAIQRVVNADEHDDADAEDDDADAADDQHDADDDTTSARPAD